MLNISSFLIKLIFRCKELLHYVSTLVQTNRFSMIFVNYFGEYHGKSYCDARFSRLSVFLNEYAKLHWIRSLDDVVHCINQKQNESNERRVRQGKSPIISYQFILEKFLLLCFC